jgi:hypothetical protein
MAKSQQEVVRQGYRALVEALGVVDALRFIQYFNPGQGDYTQERREWLEQVPLTDILTSMKQRQDNEIRHFDEVIE